MRNIKTLRSPWKPGQSGNPKGKKKGVRTWHVVLRERFEEGRITQDQIADAMLKNAKKGNTKSAELVWDRMDGKAKEMHTIEGQTKIIPLDMIDNPQLKEELLLAELDKLKRESMGKKQSNPEPPAKVKKPKAPPAPPPNKKY